MTPLHAVVLGAVEGFTEFLPISSTGHLILVTYLLGLSGEAVKTFEVVIQAGALGAVAALYHARITAMWRGLLGRDAAGRRLFWNLILSFLPAAVVGVLLHRTIKTHLFAIGPVAAALAAGGVLMLGVDWWSRRARGPARGIESMTTRDALLIGAAQCLALWPGTSRAMTTIVAGLLLGFPATTAAEYSFLLALPTLGAATLFDASLGGGALLQEAGLVSVACGFAGAAGIAALAIRGFIQYLTQRGLAPFGWYRLALAPVAWWTLRGA